MAAFNLSINGRSRAAEAAPDTPLLWVLRDHLGLTGTKFGCGLGVCGACTVLVDGEAKRSCQIPVSSLGAEKITTIEGLGGGHPVQKAWIAEDVAQCGYCQPGQILQAVSLLAQHPQPSEAQIDAAMAENVCRCGTYQRIRCAIHRAAGEACSRAAIPSSPDVGVLAADGGGRTFVIPSSPGPDVLAAAGDGRTVVIPSSPGADVGGSTGASFVTRRSGGVA